MAEGKADSKETFLDLCQAEVSGQKEKPDPQRPGEKRGRQGRDRGSLSKYYKPKLKKPSALSETAGSRKEPSPPPP